jgi:hypothetical protein
MESNLFTINENDYQWIVNSDNESVTLIKFIGTIVPEPTAPNSLLAGTSINTPYALDGKVVTVIGPGAYQNNKNFDRVVFHSNLISIEAGAFAGCSNLQYISFYDDSQLKFIKQDAFLDTKISAPVIPASVTRIERGAFNTKMLDRVTFNGNAPVYTMDSFNSQTTNNNLRGLITLIYYTNAIGFNNPKDDKFSIIVNNKMIIPPEPTIAPDTEKSSALSIIKYIIYFLLFVLLCVGLIFIFRRYSKKNISNTIDNNIVELKESDLAEQ